jgi:hypothetical protein
MEVRIGARKTTGLTKPFTMMPETHNVTFLIFARNNATELQMVSRTTFRNLETDEVLREIDPNDQDEDFLTNVLVQMADLDDKAINTVKKELKGHSAESTAFREAYESMVNSVFNIVFDTNSIDSKTFVDFMQPFSVFFSDESVKRILMKAGVATRFFSNPFDGMDINDIDALWLDAVRVDKGDQYANDRVRLPGWSPILPPEDETVAWQDDDLSQCTRFTVINNGLALPSERLTAKLYLMTKNDAAREPKAIFYSRDIKATDNRTGLAIQFPLLSMIALSHDGPTNQLQPLKLDLICNPDDPDNCGTNHYSKFAFITPLPANKRLAAVV